MSDFKYNIVPVPSGGPIASGTAVIATTSISISPVNTTGLDLTNFLSGWADDAAMKVPFDLEFTVDGGEPITVEVTEVRNEVEDSGDYQPRVRFAVTDANTLITATSGVLSAELGLKVKQKDRPCGGYEEFDIDDADPTCTNGITFKNVSSGREFKFSNLRKGFYSIYFEGPNERYEIVWDTPSGECDQDRIGVLNRVQGKTLYLEDYGNSPYPEDIDFGDLIITIKNGSYEWAGGDTDPVFYTTVNNGTLCGPGEICSGGNCVTDTSTAGSLDFDDILLVHKNTEDELYSVRAGDYMSRYNSTNVFPITRGTETFNSGILDFDDFEDTDSVAVYRPSESTVYKISGKQYTDEFNYPRGPRPKVNGVILRYKNGGDTNGLSGQSFVVDIDAPQQEGVTYKIITRILGKGPVGAQNPTLNMWAKPRYFEDFQEYLDSDRSESIQTAVFGDVYSDFGPGTTWTQEGGASMTIVSNQSSRDYWTVSGYADLAYDDQSRTTGNFTFSGTPDFDKPFTLTNGEDVTRKTPFLLSYVGPPTHDGGPGLGTFKWTENLNLFEGVTSTLFINSGNIAPCSWDISDVDLQARTATMDYNSCDPVGGSTPQSTYEQNVNLINNQTSDTYFFNRRPGSAGFFLDITEGSSDFDEVEEVGTLSSIGNKTIHEWTMDASVTIKGSDPESFFDGAFMTVYVIATRGQASSDFVISNTLQIL